jgi:hypothetical protein
MAKICAENITATRRPLLPKMHHCLKVRRFRIPVTSGWMLTSRRKEIAMSRQRAFAFFLVFLVFSALPGAAQPARAKEAAGLGQRWTELWQSFLAPLALLTGEGRAIWDPNGSDSTADDATDGRAIWDPNGNPVS